MINNQEPKLECQIGRIRREKGITIEDFVKGTGISRASIWRYESGERLPDLKLAYKIASFLGCSLDELIKIKQAEEREI